MNDKTKGKIVGVDVGGTFTDLVLGRRTRPQAYGMFGEFTPIIPRDLRLEVSERLLAMAAFTQNWTGMRCAMPQNPAGNGL